MAGGPGVVSGGHEIGAGSQRNMLAGILMAAFAAFGGILYGYDTGVINGVQAMDDWLRTFGEKTDDLTNHPTGYYLPSSKQSLVISILSLGTFCGALLGAPVADFIGRRLGICTASAIFSVGVAMQTASTALPLFIAGRVIAGVGVGMVSTLAPMYQSECSPKWIRGAVVSAYQWAITIGLLLSSVINNATESRNNHSSYRIPIAIQFIWAFVLTSGMLYLPESPRYLVMKGREADAAKSLARLTNSKPEDTAVQDDVNEIRVALEEERKIGNSTYMDCFRTGTSSKIAFRVWTGMALQAWQQLTGINFIFYYGTYFFQNSGIKNSFLITVATNIVNVFMTIPGMYGVERYGRRRLLLIGAAGMCICEFIIAIAGVTVSKSNIAGQKVLIAFVCIYIAFFASTWGPVAWVLTGEIFPLNVRAKGVSLSAASNWLWNFGIGYATPYLVNSGKGNANLQAKVFFIWGSTCACCIIFTYFCIPETRGLSLEQIDLLYTHSTPMTSVHMRNRLLEENINAADHAIFEGDKATPEKYEEKV